MTIKEMLKKVETYNEVAKVLGTEEAELWIDINGYTNSVVEYRNLKNYLKREYLKSVADAILDYSDYEFDKHCTLEVSGLFGDTFSETVSFFLAYRNHY